MTVRWGGTGGVVIHRLDTDITDDPLDNYRHVTCTETDCYDHLKHLLVEDQGNCLTLFHVNIRSYHKNIDELFVLLESLQIYFDIIIISEAWLNEDQNLINLDNYDLHYTTEAWNRNDGVVVYIKSNLCAKSKEIRLGDVRGLELNFDLDKRHYSLLATYRSPSMDCYTFLTDLDNYYSTITNNTSYLLVGDTNIDILETTNTAEKDAYLNLLYNAGFISCIDKPTRVTNHSQTCIDHIFIRHFDYRDITAAVLRTNVTDHYAVTARIGLGDQRIDDTFTTEADTTYTDTQVLTELLSKQSWHLVLAQHDVNTSCDEFFYVFEDMKKTATRSKKTTSRHRKIKPWITVDLIRGIKERDKLSKRLKRQPHNDQLKLQYNTFRNNLSKSLRRVKVQYYKSKILNAAGDQKEFWKIVNEYGGMSKRKCGFPIKYFLKGSIIPGGGAIREVANEFNQYFSQVGHNLARELPPVAGPPVVDDTAHRTEHVLQLEPVTRSQVEKCVMEMRGGSAPGVDGLLASILKNNIKYFILPLTYIINLSITSEIFPNRLKTAKVIPIYKSNEKCNKSNYRPISLLSVVAKVLEKCVKWQLQTYLESNKLLSHRQYGFRKGKNSSDALFLVNKSLMDSVNENKKCLCVFIDLAKAFDSLDRKLLFSKLESIGVRGISLNWFESYLSDRSQIVSISNHSSTLRNVEYGVVQGSTLGPLLFLIYINNIDKLNLLGRIFLFADDTAVIFEGDNWDGVFALAAKELKLIKQWFDQNILSMNVNKTKCMPVALRAGVGPPAGLELRLHSCGDTDNQNCNCRIIEKVDNYKYLGVIIDSKLRWDIQTNSLKKKLRKLTYVFRQLSFILNATEFKVTYFSFVQSILEYGILAWGGAAKTIIDSLCVIQKSVIKAGLQKNKRYSSVLLFQETGLLTVRQLFIKNLLAYIYSNKDIILSQVTHGYQTRNAINFGFQVPRRVKSINSTNSHYIANVLYRNIPPLIRNCQVSPRVYKHLITTWLLRAGPEYADTLLASVYTT